MDIDMNVGRKKYKITSLSIHPDVHSKLNDLAKKYSTSRSRVIEYFINTYYDKLMDKDTKKKKEGK